MTTPIPHSLQFVDQILTIKPDRLRTIAQLIADGGYRENGGPAFTKFIEWFGATGTFMGRQTLVGAIDCTEQVEIILLHYKKLMSTHDVRADMERQGLRRGSLSELLWIGVQHPRLQLKFSIVELGTISEIHIDPRVAYLGRMGQDRILGSICLENQDEELWDEYTRFTAVRNRS